jgi:putative hydrolase of the HAD superfamily
MPFQALIFDLGGVIVPHDNELLYARLAARCAGPDPLSRIRAFSGEAPYGAGDLPIEHLHTRMCEDLGYLGGWDEFATTFCSHLSIDPDMLALASALAERHRVLLLSNTNKVHWEHVLNLSDGALGRFEAYLSHEIGAVKPDAEAYLRLAERAGVEPGRCIFFDDVMANVEAARLAGFQAEQFTTQAALEALLERCGVALPQIATGDVR